MPEAPVTQTVTGARGYHGLLIDEDGWMIGADDGGNLMRATRTGDVQLFVPGAGRGQQMAWLSSDSFAWAAENDALQRMHASGGTELITAGLNAYAVVKGRDGLLYTIQDYTAPVSDVVRVDPATGESEVWLDWDVDGPGDGDPHSLAFNRENNRMFIGTIYSGTIFVVELDNQLNPLGPPQPFATDVGGWHDAIAVDLCENLYVPDFFSSTLFRVDRHGQAVEYWTGGFDAYTHGLLWGTGTFGWSGTALYAPQPYNDHSVIEIDVGVPPASAPRIAINLPGPPGTADAGPSPDAGDPLDGGSLDQWICPAAWYNSGGSCDCGCGIRDEDCDGPEPVTCAYVWCNPPGDGQGGTVDPTNSGLCL